MATTSLEPPHLKSKLAAGVRVVAAPSPKCLHDEGGSARFLEESSGREIDCNPRRQIDVAGRIAIETYALVCAQHKTIEARLDQDGLFTQPGRRRSAFDMLKSISETIDRLRAQLPPLPASTPTTTNVDLSPDAVIAKAERVIRMARLLKFEPERRSIDATPG